MVQEGLFKIGEVAKLFGVSVGTLHHYERLGIVIPEVVDPQTGYRYYGPRQFECLNTVRYLRALDMPLDQIAGFFKNRSVDTMRTMLISQREEVERMRHELERMERKIDRRLERIDDAVACTMDKVELAETPAQRLAMLKTSVSPRHFLDLEMSIRELEQDQSGFVFLGKVGVGISKETLEAGKFDTYELVFLILDDEDEFSGETVSVPAQQSLRIRFRGTHGASVKRYKMLLKYARENGYEVCGFSREIALIDDGLTSDQRQHVTEISLPVRRA